MFQRTHCTIHTVCREQCSSKLLVHVGRSVAWGMGEWQRRGRGVGQKLHVLSIRPSVVEAITVARAVWWRNDTCGSLFDANKQTKPKAKRKAGRERDRQDGREPRGRDGSSQTGDGEEGGKACLRRALCLCRLHPPACPSSSESDPRGLSVLSLFRTGTTVCASIAAILFAACVVRTLSAPELQIARGKSGARCESELHRPNLPPPRQDRGLVRIPQESGLMPHLSSVKREARLRERWRRAINCRPNSVKPPLTRRRRHARAPLAAGG